MKRFRRGMAFLAVCALLLCVCAYADSFSDWAARYNVAAQSAGLSPIADAQNIGYGAYGVLLDDGGTLAVASDDSAVGGVIVAGISSRDRLALVCGAALYACDSTLTIETAMEKMKTFVGEDDAVPERLETTGGWVYMLETDGTDTIVTLMREDLFAAFAADGADFPALPEEEQPSGGEATPSEVPSEPSVLPEATSSPALHKI